MAWELTLIFFGTESGSNGLGITNAARFETGVEHAVGAGSLSHFGKINLPKAHDGDSSSWLPFRRGGANVYVRWACWLLTRPGAIHHSNIPAKARITLRQVLRAGHR